MPFNRQNHRRLVWDSSSTRIIRQMASAGSEKLVDLAAIRDARSTLQSINLARWRSPASGRWTEANEAIKTARKALDAARDAVQRAIDADD